MNSRTFVEEQRALRVAEQREEQREETRQAIMKWFVSVSTLLILCAMWVWKDAWMGWFPA